MVRRGVGTDEDNSLACIDIFSPTGQAATKAIIGAFAVSEVLCLAAAGWLVWKVNHQTAYSSRTKAMHLQLTWLLIAQMLSPVICMFIPMAAIALNGILRLYLGLPVIYPSLLVFSLFPMVNAVFTVGFVAPYRRFTMDLLRRTVKISAAQYSFTSAQSGMHENAMRRAGSIPPAPS